MASAIAPASKGLHSLNFRENRKTASERMIKPTKKTFALVALLLISLFTFSSVIVQPIEGQLLYQIHFIDATVGGHMVINWGGLDHNAGYYMIAVGTVLIITGVADTGYTFNNFHYTAGTTIGDTSNNPFTVTVAGGFTLSSYFTGYWNQNDTSNFHDITFTCNQEIGQGSIIWFITSNGALNGQGTQVFTTSTVTLTAGTQVRVYSNPPPGYAFANYTVSGGTQDGTTSVDPLDLTVASNFTVTESFHLDSANQVQFNLSSTTGGFAYYVDYTGTTLISPFHYWEPIDTNINLNAQLDPGYSFDHWEITTSSGTEYSTVLPLPLTLSQDYSIKAVFTNQGLGGPSPTPGGFSISTLRTDLTTVFEMVIAAIFVIISILLLMKVPGAWMPAIILLIIGFVLSMISQPNLYGLVAFALEIILSAVFGFSGTGQKGK
jgi:hypothetical protein